jgi:type I restriction enzyme, R subunit
MAYFIKNGVLDKILLYESPFTDINDQSLNGLFEDAKVIQLVRIIDRINNNATLA